ncbi:conserved hypothetical protein [Ricinus communis]|uniref:Uncharacterized protein n=1 Tax=Ricinus communis TaxID=3988 RepID=B9TN21_RICCO|nr:conserved hypothetical protein [Ricinus communis]
MLTPRPPLELQLEAWSTRQLRTGGSRPSSALGADHVVLGIGVSKERTRAFLQKIGRQAAAAADLLKFHRLGGQVRVALRRGKQASLARQSVKDEVRDQEEERRGRQVGLQSSEHRRIPDRELQTVRTCLTRSKFPMRQRACKYLPIHAKILSSETVSRASRYRIAAFPSHPRKLAETGVFWDSSSLIEKMWSPFSEEKAPSLAMQAPRPRIAIFESLPGHAQGCIGGVHARIQAQDVDRYRPDSLRSANGRAGG